MIPASLLALHLHVPLTTVTDYLEGRIMESGSRLSPSGEFSLSDSAMTVLVVDDSVYTGRQMSETKQRIDTHGVANNVLYAAPYVTPGTEHLVDLHHEVIPQPRVFEWNIMHHEVLSKACVDIDGVLCRDPTPVENDDGANYRTFLQSVEPLFQPQKPIRALVTNRLEKYRGLTEEWLDRRGIEYEQLIMMDYPTKAARKRANRYVDHKAQAYLKTKAKLFIESSLHQAQGIAREAGMPVYCVSTRNLITPNKLSTQYALAQTRSGWERLKKFLERTWESPGTLPRRLLEKVRRTVSGPMQ
jgi:orotate phosphoribosyltransferase